jgi:integrase
MFTVARMAGHKSVAMIEQHYGHVIEHDSEEAVDVVSEAIGRTVGRVAV